MRVSINSAILHLVILSLHMPYGGASPADRARVAEPTAGGNNGRRQADGRARTAGAGEAVEAGVITASRKLQITSSKSQTSSKFQAPIPKRASLAGGPFGILDL